LDDVPRLTVAIPTYNGARHLREALLGIQAQHGVEFDLIVSDDRSEDDTLAIARDVVGDRARISVNSERLGLAGNWNRCVELSRTEWVAIFHQDDAMMPGHLAGIGETMAVVEGTRTGLIACNVRMIDQSGKPLPPWVVSPGGIRPLCDRRRGVSPKPERRHEIVFPPGSWLSKVASDNPFRCSAVTTRKSAHATVGGFDPTFKYVVDWDFWVRVARGGWGLAWRLDPPSVSVRWHSESETHRFVTGTTDLDEQIQLLHALFETDGPRLEDLPGVRQLRLRKRGQQRLARAFLNRSHMALKRGDLELARECLSRSVGLSRGVFWTMAVDPRLAVQMAALTLSPARAKRWFGRSE
jgi:GT2 family glycosyltransferase